MEVRKFVEGDREIFLQFTNEFYHSNSVLHAIPRAHMQNAFEEILRGSPYIDGFVLIREEVIAGYALLCYTYSMELGGMIAILDELYISPAFRGQGIGSQFLNYMKSHLSQGIKAFRLEFVPAKKELQTLYEKNGFNLLGYASMLYTE